MRIKDIVLTELIHNRLLIYDKIERLMNSKGKAKIVSKKIKKQLRKLTTLNGMITEWEGMIRPSELTIPTKEERNEEIK
tara:strand:- start:9098 stop:9334 length:237 start_codon:yes stop_codon:yes gene_type:complete